MRIRTLLLNICTLLLLHVGMSQNSWAAIQDKGEYYIVSDYYQKVLGLTADGTKPRLSTIGTNADANSYVFIAEASSKFT